MYSTLRSLLFRLPAETAHDLTLDMLGTAGRLGLATRFNRQPASLPVNVMGLDFPNPVGLAAGLDKNAQAVDGLAALGFGFIEVGTVTPRPQPGNPKPRMFRLQEQKAIINRMGFNNQGVDTLLERLAKVKYQGVLGINIGKNAVTPVEQAVDDYLYCLRKVYGHASYVTVNLSSPNTPGLRTLQYGDVLQKLLEQIKQAQLELANEHGRYVPIAIKIAPDMAPEELVLVANTLVDQGMDAVIATNTTLARDAVAHLPHGDEAGGLSGGPLTGASTEVVRLLAQELNGRLPIIGVGGILCGADAAAKIAAGASLVQIYSGFIYRGPALIRESVDAIAAQ
ncbi:MAG: quinone-dependent dihydroorotate dehydrogenase [Pseudomonadaceae bacterium]|nr:MAG: quinone-dependent dihydroorotate dehydrogenase [Pseudomonadaceae bacterium]